MGLKILTRVGTFVGLGSRRNSFQTTKKKEKSSWQRATSPRVQRLAPATSVSSLQIPFRERLIVVVLVSPISPFVLRGRTFPAPIAVVGSDEFPRKGVSNSVYW